MNERIRVIVTWEQLNYIAERAELKLITVPNRNGDYDLIIGERENKEVRDGD